MRINGIGERKQLEITHTNVGSILIVIHTYGVTRPTHITVDPVWFAQAMETEVKERESNQARGIAQVPKQRDSGTSEETTGEGN